MTIVMIGCLDMNGAIIIQCLNMNDVEVRYLNMNDVTVMPCL